MDIWNDLTDAFNKDMAIDEMSKKYKDTYLVIAKPDKQELVARYKGYGNGFHYFQDELKMDIKLQHETNCSVVCVFPERRLFNSNNQALEFVRKPNRQYRRGICKDNMQIYSPIRKYWGGDDHPWDIHTIKHALYPTYPANCEEALNSLLKGTAVSVALNEKFFVSLSFTTTKDIFYVFYCNVCIGFFKKDVIYIKHALFKQEVLDNMTLFSPYRIEF